MLTEIRSPVLFTFVAFLRGSHSRHISESIVTQSVSNHMSLQESCCLAGQEGYFEEGLDENYRLRTWNLKTSATAHIFACQHIVNPDQIIARLLKTSSIHFVRPFRRLSLLGSFQPADIVLGALATMRANISRFLYLFLFVEEISFVHKPALITLAHKAPVDSGSCRCRFRGHHSTEN